LHHHASKIEPSMLIDLKKSTKDKIEFNVDICIVGAGPAGITIARELIDSDRKVLLVESGGLKEDREALSLYEGYSIGQPVELTFGRYRVLGGASLMWSGRCAQLDRMDFEYREWIPRSGWPISYDELAPYYEKAISTCNFNEKWKEFSDIQKILNIEFPALESGNLVPFVWRVAPPDRYPSLWNRLTFGYRASFKFGSAYLPELERAKNLDVLIHANLVQLIAGGEEKAVRSAEFSTLDGRTARVTAKAFVISCSGIENARILLNMPEGLLRSANAHNQIGRCFAQHPRGVIGIVEATPQQALILQKTFNNFLRPKYIPVQYEIGVALSEEAQRKYRLLNASLALYYEADDYSIWKTGKRIRESIKSRSFDRQFLKDILTVSLGVHAVGTNIIRRWILGRELWHKNPIIRAIIDLEQVPRPESRITLSSDVDAVGMRKCIVDWRLGELERHTAKLFADFLDEELRASGLGVLRKSNWLTSETPPSEEDLQSNLHFIGATRMAARPEDGVVDKNCKVFGVENLFMAGASVFSIGGHGNPMTTIVALATRLGEHLRDLDLTDQSASPLCARNSFEG
jgi:choline dehydrogenase-like flavoprotein